MSEQDLSAAVSARLRYINARIQYERHGDDIYVSGYRLGSMQEIVNWSMDEVADRLDQIRRLAKGESK